MCGNNLCPHPLVLHYPTLPLCSLKDGAVVLLKCRHMCGNDIWHLFSPEEANANTTLGPTAEMFYLKRNQRFV